MHPILFEIGGFPVYTYGVLLAAAYLLGLQFALRRAKARGLDANRVMDLGIWIIVSALVGAKLLLLVVEWDTYRRNPAELLTLVRSGGVFYGGLILAVLVAFWYMWRHRHAALVGLRRRSRPASRSATSSAGMGCFFAGCCFGRPTTVPWAITFTQRVRQPNVGTPINRPLHPTQLYEAGAELLILGHPARHRAQRTSVPGPDVLGLHAALRDLALHHRVLPRRHPGDDRHVLDVPVRLDADRADQHRHADPAGAAASNRPRTPRPRAAPPEVGVPWPWTSPIRWSSMKSRTGSGSINS